MALPNITRRTFLKAAGAASASLATGVSFAINAPNRPPNILLIMTDEHNASVAGCYGSRVARTPNIDRLAGQGVSFDACYCNSPLCVPSRSSFTAGKYCSRVSVWNNSCELPRADYPAIPSLMNAAGYQSLLCGKQHYAAGRRYGFVDVGGNFNKSFKTGRGNRRQADDLAAPKQISERFAQFHTGGQGGVLGHDSKVTAGSVDFLRRRAADDKPFFLFSGYLAPHFPLIVPQRFYEHFRGQIALPRIPPGHLDSLPLNYKHLRIGFKVVNVPDETVRLGRELYHGLTEWVDDQIGQVLQALSQSAAAENTVVIYTADHGENMGEHGMWWKNCMFEHAARIPLIVSWPKRWTGGQRRSQACSLVDVVKLIADIGGSRVPEDWNGDSLLPWLDDAGHAWKDRAVSEYYAHNIASGYAMLRSGAYKYVYHTSPDKNHPAQQELYDLAADPAELANLASRPEQAQRLKQLRDALIKEIGEDPEATERRCRAETAKGYGVKAPPGAKAED
jgi:choline-sulfatase